MTNDSSAKVGFQLLQKWYKRRCGVKLPMSHYRLKMVAKSYEELYSKRQPALEMFSFQASTAHHFEVNNKQFTDDETRKVAMKLRAGCAPGPNGFCQDMVKLWANAEQRLGQMTQWPFYNW